MKLKNVKVGQRVQMKNIDEIPTECSYPTGREFGLIEENLGTVLGYPDSDGDVQIEFDDFTSEFSGTSKLYVHHSKIRKVK